jgi:hypothetical protein
MSRSWRIEFDGALYHVLSQGNEQQNIFSDDADRELFFIRQQKYFVFQGKIDKRECLGKIVQ